MNNQACGASRLALCSRAAVILAVAAWAALSAGCGAASQATVTGQVLVDGKPLASGVISFVNTEGEPSPVTANVENGQYTVRTTPGNKLVQISATVVEKRREYDAPDAPFVDAHKETLPDKYHVKSELTFEVKSGANEKDWKLSTR